MRVNSALTACPIDLRLCLQLVVVVPPFLILPLRLWWWWLEFTACFPSTGDFDSVSLSTAKS